MQELEALLNYLVKHNDEHASEISELAGRAREMGKHDTFRHLTEGVELLLQSNESLRAALAALEVKDVSS